MRLELTNTSATLYREEGDKRLNSENAVTHAMKTLLRAQGFDAARIRGPVGLTACKQVLQVRDARFALWHERYAIEMAHEAFNRDRSVTYQRVNDELDESPRRLNAREAFDIASQWGSYMHTGDPGGVFYSFSFDKVVVQDREHQRQLLAYTDACMREAKPKQRTELQRLRHYFESACIPDSLQLDAFTEAYIKTALWSSNDESDDRGGEPLDKNFSISDLDLGTFNQMSNDCKKFQLENYDTLEAEYLSDTPKATASMAGHDFWLTRNGHGAGFSDGDWQEAVGEKLAKAAEAYGDCDLYVGDDGFLYI